MQRARVQQVVLTFHRGIPAVGQAQGPPSVSRNGTRGPSPAEACWGLRPRLHPLPTPHVAIWLRTILHLRLINPGAYAEDVCVATIVRRGDRVACLFPAQLHTGPGKGTGVTFHK